MTTDIYIDGSCSRDGNIRISMIHNRYRIVKNVGRGNSNIAEYKALIYALLYIKYNDVHNVTILTDFKTIVEQMTQQATVRSKNIKPLFQRAQELIQECKNIQIKYIQRKENLADKLFKIY